MQTDFETAFKDFEKRNSEAQELRHQQMMEQVNELEKKIDPVTKVYAQVQGFGNVAVWIFKYIVIPVSILVGILLNLKNISK